MKQPKTKKSPLTNSESGIVLRKEASVAEYAIIKGLYKHFSDATASIETNSIQATNLAREMGIHLQTLCGGRENINKEFWKKNELASQLGFDFNAATLFCSVARKVTHPVSSIVEASTLLQTCLIASGQLVLPERSEQHHAVAVGSFQKFLTDFAFMRTAWSKTLREQPMKNWNQTKLRSFVADAKWLVDDYQTAKGLLEK